MEGKEKLPHGEDPDLEEAEIATEDLNANSFQIHIPANISPFKASQYTTCNINSPSKSLSKKNNSIFSAFTGILGFEITKFRRFSITLILFLVMTSLSSLFLLEVVIKPQSERTQDDYAYNQQPCLPSNLIGAEKPVLYTPNKTVNATCSDDVIYSAECDCYKVNIERVSNSVVIAYLKRILLECIKTNADKVIHIVTGHKHELYERDIYPTIKNWLQQKEVEFKELHGFFEILGPVHV